MQALLMCRTIYNNAADVQLRNANYIRIALEEGVVR